MLEIYREGIRNSSLRYATNRRINEVPYSYDNLDDKIELMLKKYKVKNHLDIGCGEGKFGSLIRKVNKDANILGIEPYKPYISKYKLDKIYDKILNIKANDLLKKTKFKTDFVVMGDVLEHLTKSEGLDFIHWIIYRTRYLLIKYPGSYHQESDNILEEHKSLWNSNDFNHFRIMGVQSDGKFTVILLDGIQNYLGGKNGK